jgi:GNAT superfamily N-acetyltransferase
MPDMLVKLYDLPSDSVIDPRVREAGIVIRRAMPPEKSVVVEWVRSRFSQGWANECEVSFSHQPVSTFLAVADNEILGFACYECTWRDYFGPTGVAEEHRKRGIGKALLLASLHAMRDYGYAYAIIGGAGPTAFYERACGAKSIEGSEPGMYRGMIRPE